MRLGHVTLLALCGLGFAGCVTTPRVPPADWNQVKSERQALEQWEMSGRAAVATASEGWTASVSWTQSGSNSDLQLRGAFGVGGVRVHSDGQSFEIETGKGERLTADDAASALEQAIGVPLPVRQMRYWLLGVPAPGTPAQEEVDAQGRLAKLEQDGWQATYERYALQNDAWLPARLKLEQGELRVKVIVYRWSF